jgi:type II secretory pathway pseudopilin PulG
MSPAKKKGESASDVETAAAAEASTDAAAVPNPAAAAGYDKKRLIWIAAIVVVMWAFAIATGSMVVMIIVGVLTLLVAGVLVWAYRLIRKQRGLVSTLQGAQQSPEARRAALAQLAEGKDANTPTTLFARAQLLAADDPKAALALIERIDLKSFQAAMQDDVALLKTQLFLNTGRTQDARKTADFMNLDNPERAQVRSMAATIVAEAWARTGKPKEALALLDTVVVPKKDEQQLGLQIRVVRVFARFAINQRSQARTEMVELADLDINQLGRFVLPQFRVHPELVKLARQVLEQHPSSRRQNTAAARKNMMR